MRNQARPRRWWCIAASHAIIRLTGGAGRPDPGLRSARWRQSVRAILLSGIAGVVIVVLVAGLSCNSSSSLSGGSPGKRNDLNAMETAALSINGHRFSAWVARTPQQRELGLMQVAAQEMTPLPDGTERGMLFIFEQEQQLEFWMKNTIIPLDIAFLRSDGQIVKTYTMAPLETRLYPSVMPAMMALEVNAGLWGRLGIAAGDTVQIPESLLKPGAP